MKKTIFETITVVAMVIGLILTASEQESLIPNIIGVVLLCGGAFIYKKLND
jgi:hypothetical protein